MCPACLASAATAVTALVSSGGVTALILKLQGRLPPKSTGKKNAA
jgi:hypothetical protein